MDIYAGGSVQNNGGHATDAHRNVPEHSVPWSREPPRELRQPPANGMFCSSRLEAHHAGGGGGGPAKSTPRKHAAPYSAGGLPFAGTSVHQHGNEAALAAQAKQLLNHWEPWQGRAYREEGHFEPQRASTARSTASLCDKNETIARLSAEVQALQAARGTRSSGGRSRGSSRAGARPRSSSNSSNNGNNTRPRTSSSSSSWKQPPDLASEAAAAGLALYRAAPPSRGAIGAYPQGGGGALGAGPSGYLATEAAALERQRAFMAGMPSVNLSGDGPGAPPPVLRVPIGRARPDTRGPFGRPANDGRSAVALREELRETAVFPGSWVFRDAEDPARRVGDGHASMRLATPASPRGTRALPGGGSMKMFFSEGSSIRTELQPELAQGQRLLRKANLTVGSGGGNGNARPSSRGQPPPRRGSLSFGRETMAPGPAASYRAPTPSQRRQSSRQREEIASVRDLF
jgi:hypothetical protein